MIFDYLNVDDVYDWLKVVHKNDNILLEYMLPYDKYIFREICPSG